MTDPTTGIQVAPTEAEMSQVQDILRRAINAIVGMSQLQADVDMLRSTVTALQADTEKLRQQNAGLDEALYQSRNARNDLTSKLAQAEHDRDEALATRDSAIRERDRVTSEAEDLRQRLADVSRERDDYGLRNLDLEDQLRAAEAKLASIREGYASIFGAPQTPEPPQAKPEPSNYQAQAQVDKPSEPLPEPTMTLGEAPRRYLGERWEPGALWDEQRREYYLEAPSQF